ncbi:TauD/TfdA dioxygenase family protein [Saccharospirillum impatiens]|uniref:TauD/TfdA dioxygenase family protein n=1 Tax=Saccharospirillum impatiens TaxID=169438 RepID=UPI00040F5A76|nr:TauD/TfdA family dioxygenase [Saccharospirillum impatiens]
MTQSTTAKNNDKVASLSIKRNGVFIGAEVRGVDLSRPLDDATAEAIRIAHARHGVLAFPDQNISSEDLRRFGRYFGELTVHPFSTSAKEAPELIVYDNKEGNPPAPTDIWHTDETFRDCPPMGTVLCSKIIPELGGDTNFASMEAVYEGLSDRMQRFLSGLVAIHDFKPFRMLFDQTADGIRKLRQFEDRFPPVEHPVVRIHPVTGKKSIFVNPQFTLAIKGMEEDESRTILDMIYRKTLRNEFQYRHHWEPNMVVFWDNRSVQHSAVHDYYPQRRLMERVTIAGDRPCDDVEPVDVADLRRYLMPPVTAFKTRAKRQHED